MRTSPISRRPGGCRNGAAGEALPRPSPAALLQYRAFAAIGDQLERFMARVPAAQRIVIVHDDFRADTRGEYLRALALLGLSRRRPHRVRAGQSELGAALDRVCLTSRPG